MDRFAKAVTPDQFLHRRSQFIGRDDTIEPHHFLGKLQPSQVIGDTKQIHVFIGVRPIAANALEDAGTVFDGGRVDMDRRLGPRHKVAVEIDQQILIVGFRHVRPPRAKLGPTLNLVVYI